MVMAGDAELVEKGGHGDYLFGDTMAFPPVKVGDVLHDGSNVTLGGTTLVAHLTPGHTKGCTTWTTTVREDGLTYSVVFPGSGSVNPGTRLVKNPSYPGIRADYEKTFRVLSAMHPDVFLGAHAGFFGLDDKRAALAAGKTPNPFIDPAGFQALVKRQSERFHEAVVQGNDRERSGIWTVVMDDLVERRIRYIERQKLLHKESVDVDAASQSAMGTGQPNRHGKPQLPVGQHVVRNWPVLDLGDVPDISTDEWTLEVGGLVENPVTLTWKDFLALPQAEDVSDFHCVTTWSRFDNHWKGVRFRTIAELVVPQPDVRHVLTTGYDHMPGTRIPYTTNVPLARAIEEDVLLVHTWQGQPLPREHGGPVRMITPKLYAWKGAKWIHRVDFLAEDQKGFWELRGYSNTAEPWANDRYSS